MTAPPALVAGDTVRIISTARKVVKDELDPAVEVLHGWGLRVEFGAHLFEAHHQFAGTADQRASDLQAAIDDPDVRAILCARGGYGTVQVLDKIDLSHLKEDPKWIVGYSDVTVLHAHVHMHCGVETVHGSMPVNFGRNSTEALESLRRVLFGGSPFYEFAFHKLNRHGRGGGPLVGGNLSILYSLTGTPDIFDTRGKVLVMEDVDEYLYHIDRMMRNLQRGGFLEGLQGLIVGGMTDMNDNNVPYGYSAEESICSVVDAYEFPVAFDAPFGHFPDNRALVMGREVDLEVKDGGVSLGFR